MYLLFILSTVLIAAAGNAINDYFDIRSDRLNRPEKIIIGKKLKKRWAIVVHWGFNALAVMISIYLGFSLNTWFFLFIHLLSSTLLWAYSVYLKRVFFWSNLIIALLVALIPLIGSVFMLILGAKTEHLTVVSLFSTFAFLINFAREILKDIQDIGGDQLVNVRSLPLVLGIPRSRLMVFLLCIAIWIPYFFLVQQLTIKDHVLFYVLFSSAASLTCFVAIFVRSIRDSRLSLLLKISMLLGVLSLFQL